jgi:hypothetical protein
LVIGRHDDGAAVKERVVGLLARLYCHEGPLDLLALASCLILRRKAKRLGGLACIAIDSLRERPERQGVDEAGRPVGPIGREEGNQDCPRFSCTCRRSDDSVVSAAQSLGNFHLVREGVEACEAFEENTVPLGVERDHGVAATHISD